MNEGALYHHERYDGKGYPAGLAGEDIPLIARMICVADSFDAMNTNRVYRAKRTPSLPVFSSGPRGGRGRTGLGNGNGRGHEKNIVPERPEGRSGLLFWTDI